MARATTIYEADMREFLEERGFQVLDLRDGTRELTLGRIVDKNLCLRVYTSIVHGESRGNGQDAIRCVLFTRMASGEVRVVGADRRVHRVEGWRANLQDRLDRWREMLGPRCPSCGQLSVRRHSRRGPFWGCIGYPSCREIMSLDRGPRTPGPGPAPGTAAAGSGDGPDLPAGQRRAP